MSTIYLPNGAKIKIHTGWEQTNEANGNLSLFSHGKKEYYGIITAAGVCHLTDECRHTYYPPSIDNVNEALNTVEDNLTKLPGWRLKRLKKQLQNFDSRTQMFK